MPPKRTRAPPKPANSSPNSRNNRKNANFVLGKNVATSSSNNNNNNFIVGSNNNNNNTANRSSKKPKVQAPVGVMQSAAPRPAPRPASRARGPPKPKLAALQGPQTQPMKRTIQLKQLKEIAHTLTPAQASRVLNVCRRDGINACHKLMTHEQHIQLIQSRLAATRGAGIVKNRKAIHNAVLNATAKAVSEGAAAEIATNPLLSGQPSPPTQQQTMDAGHALGNAQTLTDNTDPGNQSFRSAVDHAMPPLLNYLKGFGIFAGVTPLLTVADVLKLPRHTKVIASLIFPLFQKFSRSDVNAAAMTSMAATPFVMASFGQGHWASIGIILLMMVSNEAYHLKESKNAIKKIEGQDHIKQVMTYFGLIIARWAIALGIGLNPYAQTFQTGLIATKAAAAAAAAVAGAVKEGAGVLTAIFNLVSGFLGHLATQGVPALASGSVSVWEGAKTAGRRVRNAAPKVQRWGMYQKIASPARAYWNGIDIGGTGWIGNAGYLLEVWAIRIKYFALNPNRYTGMSLIMILLSIVTYLNKAHVTRAAQGLRSKISAKIATYRARRKNARNAMAKAHANRLAKANANKRSQNTRNT